MKNIIGGLVGLAVLGGGAWMLLTPDNSYEESAKDRIKMNALMDTFERTDNPTETRSSATGDRDCGDFSSQVEAQAFFESEGGPGEDPHNLDRDGDGIACESL